MAWVRQIYLNILQTATNFSVIVIVNGNYFVIVAWNSKLLSTLILQLINYSLLSWVQAVCIMWNKCFFFLINFFFLVLPLLSHLPSPIFSLFFSFQNTSLPFLTPLFIFLEGIVASILSSLLSVLTKKMQQGALWTQIPKWGVVF